MNGVGSAQEPLLYTISCGTKDALRGRRGEARADRGGAATRDYRAERQRRRISCGPVGLRGGQHSILRTSSVLRKVAVADRAVDRHNCSVDAGRGRGSRGRCPSTTADGWFTRSPPAMPQRAFGEGPARGPIPRDETLSSATGAPAIAPGQRRRGDREILGRAACRHGARVV